MTRQWQAAIAAMVALALPAAARAQDKPVAIAGARIHVEPGKVIEGGTIVFRGGKVTAVGKNAAVPADAERIDGTGKVVTAGLIEASSRIGLAEVSLVEATNEGTFDPAKSRTQVHAAYRVSDGYNPESVAIPIARAGGVTSAVAVPAGGLISGMSALLSLGDGQLTEVIAVDQLAMHATLGEDVLASAEGSRGIAVEALRELFDDARDYARRKASFDRNQTRAFAARRLDLAALGRVLRGDMPLVIRAHRSSDIATAIRLAKELGIRIVIEGGTEAWQVADALVTAKVPVVVDPFNNLPSNFDQIHVSDDNVKRLVDRGVVTAISTVGEVSNVRLLRQRCGVAIANGLTWDQALATVTTAPAQMFGLKGRGKLDRGSIADVVVWTGDPFELSSHADAVFVGGRRQSLKTRQTRLLERYRKLPRRATRGGKIRRAAGGSRSTR